MAFLEVRVNEIREVLRCWLAGDGLPTAAERAAVAAGLVRDGGEGQLCDELIESVVALVRPARTSSHGAALDLLVPFEAQIREW